MSTAAGTFRSVDKHDPEDKKALGKRLAACREAKGWKQDVAARQLGVTKAALSAWETGRNMPDALSLKKLAKLYDVSVDAILWENALSNDSMRFAAQFDALSEKQRQTLMVVMMAFVNEAVSDSRVEDALGDAQRRERINRPLEPFTFRVEDPPPPPQWPQQERRQVVLGRMPERRKDHLVPGGLGGVVFPVLDERGQRKERKK
jgi:transcriptional regulator with XRE-family HTH domain